MNEIANKFFFEWNMNLGVSFSDFLNLETENLVCRHILLNGHFNDGPFLLVRFVGQAHASAVTGCGTSGLTKNMFTRSTNRYITGTTISVKNVAKESP